MSPPCWGKKGALAGSCRKTTTWGPRRTIQAGKQQVMPQATDGFEEEKKRNLKLEGNIAIQRNKSNKFHFSE
jgi:hypothetical protein